jgi:hypothetical protein
MQIPTTTTLKGPPVVMQFYHSHALPYLMVKYRKEILQRLKDVPETLRQRNLVRHLAALGEIGGNAAWQIFRNYLDSIEHCMGEIIRGHSPSFWFHLHRRLRPMLAQIDVRKTDDTTVRLVRSIAELAYAKHGNLDKTDDLGSIIHTRLATFLVYCLMQSFTIASDLLCCVACGQAAQHWR